MIGKPESCQIYDQQKKPHALQYICIIHSHTYSEQNYCSLRIHVLSHHHQIISTSYNKLSVQAIPNCQYDMTNMHIGFACCLYFQVQRIST